jgi:hypothetical protein
VAGVWRNPRIGGSTLSFTNSLEWSGDMEAF